MMKKRLSALFLVFFVLFSLSVPFFAESDIEPTEEPETNGGRSEDPIDENLSVVEDPETSVYSFDNSCICGREYHTENNGEHSKYDCIKCGKNMYACICNCWCGSASVLDTSGKHGSVLPRICSGCNKPCPDCVCRDDKAEVLAAEKLRLNGEVSPLNIPRPENGVNIAVSLFLILILSVAAFYLPRSSFIDKKNVNDVENIDISEIFSGKATDDILKKPEKAYELPEDYGSSVKRKTVKTVTSKHGGIVIYEKIHLPWITSGNRLIDVNASVARIIVNDSDVICGDMITVSEVSEQLMSDSEPAVERMSRFPEFFGVVSEEEIAEEEVDQE